MIEFIYGVPSSGKTTLLYEKIRDKLAAGGEAVLIVPDQEALDAEASLARICRDIPTLGLRVYGFSRLADDVFRKYGGISYDLIDRSGQTLAMFLSVAAVSRSLKVYGKISPSDSSLLSALLTTVRELKRQGITPEELSRAAEGCGSQMLSDKINDISYIMPAYEAVLKRQGDDPDDVLGRMFTLLSRHGGMPGVSVYIDSFVSFTAVQMRIIELFMRTCDDTVITFGVPGPGTSADRYGLLSPIYDSERKLRAAADRSGGVTDTVLAGSHASPVMAALERTLREGSTEKLPSGGSIRFFCSDNVFDSAGLVASDIHRKLREGARCRDIAILCSDSASWRGIIDSALERYGIPYFISSRDDARQKALFRLILSALSVCENDFRCRDVCSYIKTGLLGVPTESLDLFDDYITRRNIKGAGAYTAEFTGSPDGYGLPGSAEAEEKLKLINSVREAVITPLYDLREELRSCKDAREISGALIRLLDRIGMTETLEALRKNAVAENDPDEAEMTGQLWSVFTRVTKQLCAFCGTAEMNVSQYRSLFDTVLSETDIGKIPTSTDQVTVGESGMLRVRGIKHVYLIGCNEGEFPATVTEKGLFSDQDRQALSDAGIELEAGTDMQNERMNYDFYRCACSASETATFCYCKGSAGRGGEKHPSHPVSVIGEAFPDAETVTEPPLEDVAGSRASVLEYYASHKNTRDGMLMRRLLDDSGENASMLDIPLSSKNEKLSADTAAHLMPGNIKLSPTRLTSFSGCPMQHCCGYFLRLRDSGRIEFNTAEFGNFVHYVLKLLIDDCIKDSSVICLRGEALAERIDRYMEIYCRSAFGYSRGSLTGRMRAMLKRLRKAVLAAAEDVLNELETGKFAPAATEVEFDFGKDVPPLMFDLRNGKKTYLTGKADRVDTYTENGVTYVKLVDYKTDKVNVKLEKLIEGDKSIQLFIYMLTVCHSKGIAENPVPGALFYMSVVPGTEELTGTGDVPDQKTMPRSGIANNDPAVLGALEPGLDGSDGEIYKTKAGSMIMVDGDNMEAIFDQVRYAVKDAAERMTGGDASVTDRVGDDAPCRYCAYVSVCRYTERKKNRREH